MKSFLELSNFGVKAKACLVDPVKCSVNELVAVNLKNSKVLKLTGGDFGIAIHNEDYIGFFVSWKDIKTELNDILIDNITNDLINSALHSINGAPFNKR